MKKVYLVLFAILVSSTSFAQRGGSSNVSPTGLTDYQYAQMGQRNGCSDSQERNANERFNQIMFNQSIPRAYKEGYEGGWISCKNGSSTPSGPSNGSRPCSQDFDTTETNCSDA